MDYNEMLEILRGKVLYESAEATQQRLNEIADAFERTIRERDVAIANAKALIATARYAIKERDAAVEDIQRNCPSCKHSFLNNPDMTGICKYTEICDIHGSKWEWRGAQE